MLVAQNICSTETTFSNFSSASKITKFLVLIFHWQMIHIKIYQVLKGSRCHKTAVLTYVQMAPSDWFLSKKFKHTMNPDQAGSIGQMTIDVNYGKRVNLLHSSELSSFE